MDVETANPWLSACQTPAEAAEADGSDVAVPVWGFDPGIPVAGTGYLPVVASPSRAGVSLVGAHGGAGCSTLARLSGLEDGGAGVAGLVGEGECCGDRGAHARAWFGGGAGRGDALLRRADRGCGVAGSGVGG